VALISGHGDFRIFARDTHLRAEDAAELERAGIYMREIRLFPTGLIIALVSAGVGWLAASIQTSERHHGTTREAADRTDNTSAASGPAASVETPGLITTAKLPPFLAGDKIITLREIESQNGFPAGFKGTGFTSLFEILNNHKPKSQNQTETKADYEKRLLAAYKHIKGVRFSPVRDQVIFVTEVSAIGLSYDPHRKAFAFGHYDNALDRFSFLMPSFVDFGKRSLSESKPHEAQNAFGVSATASADKVEDRKVKLDPRQQEKWKNAFLFVSPWIVRNNAQELRAVFAVKLKPPFVDGNHFDTGSPALSTPNGIPGTEKVIYGELKKIWLYDYVTGATLASAIRK
jgi:hypothetical protein